MSARYSTTLFVILCSASQASAQLLTPISQQRSVAADIGQVKTISASDFEPFDAGVTLSTGGPFSTAATATQLSEIAPARLDGQLFAGSTNGGIGDSYFDVTFQIAQPAEYILTGSTTTQSDFIFSPHVTFSSDAAVLHTFEGDSSFSERGAIAAGTYELIGQANVLDIMGGTSAAYANFVLSIVEDINLQLVTTLTPAPQETLTTLPDSVAAVAVGATYFLELWVSDQGVTNTGVSDAYADVVWSGSASVVAIDHGAIFTVAPSGTPQVGAVDELGGATLDPNVTVEPLWSRVATLEMTADAPGQVVFSLAPSSAGVAAFGRGPVSENDVALLGVVLEQVAPCSSGVLFVNAAAAPGGDGCDWAGAFNDLQQALDTIALRGSISEVRIAGGMYAPSVNVVSGDSRSASFRLPAGVAFRGGFSADPSDPSARDVNLYHTIFTGNNDFYHVVTLDHQQIQSTRLDGILIRNGLANGSSPHDRGAGLFISGTPVELVDCVVSDCAALDSGGGVYIDNAAVQMTRTPISGNRTLDRRQGMGEAAHDGGAGGGIYCENGSQLLIVDSGISSNLTGRGGGDSVDYAGNGGDGAGIGCIASTLELRNSVVEKNHAGDDAPSKFNTGRGGRAGGILAIDAIVRVQDSIIRENTTGDGVYAMSTGSGGGGGGLFIDGASTVEIIRCDIYSNASGGSPNGIPDFAGGAGDGGGILATGTTTLSMVNSTLSWNRTGDSPAAGNGGGLYFDGAAARLTNCLVTRNSSYPDTPTPYGGRGGGICAMGPMEVLDCTIVENSAADEGGGVFWAVTGVVRNSIVRANAPSQLDPLALASVEYSNIENAHPGAGNIDADALFVDPNNGDYSLGAGSPCIDAADNDSTPPDEFDLDGDSDTDEATPLDFSGFDRFRDDSNTSDTGAIGTEDAVGDIGAFEFQPQCVGDADGDLDVDLSDLAELLGDFGCTVAPCSGDTDGDDDTDITDLAKVLSAYGATCP